jgi:sortase A
MGTDTGSTLTRRARRRQQRASRVMSVLLVLGALAGGVVFAYPIAAPWIADVIQADQVVQYERSTADLNPAARERLLASAREYNANLPNGPLRDPYVINESGKAVSVEKGRGDYERQLRPDGAEPGAPMARLTIPSIDVDLPVFHGTDDTTLSRGVGHFYGSGLPVGGKGVHAVLTAHSGYVNSKLFDDLPQMRLGDEFTITVLGEVLTYRVDHIATVLPNESDLLRQVQGQDYVTLVTCTPRYVNTHRLLVRGVRVPTAMTADDAHKATAFQGKQPGFPWWTLLAFGPAALTVVLVLPRRRRKVGPGDVPPEPLA